MRLSVPGGSDRGRFDREMRLTIDGTTCTPFGAVRPTGASVTRSDTARVQDRLPSGPTEVVGRRRTIEGGRRYSRLGGECSRHRSVGSSPARLDEYRTYDRAEGCAFVAPPSEANWPKAQPAFRTAERGHACQERTSRSAPPRCAPDLRRGVVTAPTECLDHPPPPAPPDEAGDARIDPGLASGQNADDRMRALGTMSSGSAPTGNGYRSPASGTCWSRDQQAWRARKGAA